MESPVIPPASSVVHSTGMLGWALPRGREPDELAAAFTAGIALKSLDDLVRTAPAWAGCWRSRQALKCAAGDDPGPAGRVLLAHKGSVCSWLSLIEYREGLRRMSLFPLLC